MFSEIPKGKRGRHPKYTEIDYLPLATAAAKTKRGRQNYVCLARAVAFLNTDRQRFAFLLEPKLRLTILAELGRIEHPLVVMSAATEICKSRMKTGAAVGLCRRMRGKGKHDISGLAMAIRRAITHYCERYQTVSPADIAAALRMVSWE